ncbi:MAG: DUF503 domain-containing protein [Acidobacteriota bacterium]|nr:DUF503 domain-containing protein [Acidobacteriota bacterium]
MSGETYVAVAHVELHVPEARSLKAKRGPVRSMIERIKNRHKVLVIETDHQDLYQRTRLAICALSTSPVDAEARLQRVEATVNSHWSGNVLSWEIDVIQV